MVMPGLVDIHSHPSTEPFFRGVREEHGLPSMYMSGLYERGFVFRPDEPGRQAGKEVAYCEMLLTGITTVADLSGNDPGWIDLAARSGLRVFLAPGYASARWHLDNDWDLKYAWDEIGGRHGFDDALKLIDEAVRASLRPIVRHRQPIADRHLHRGPAARLPGRPRPSGTCRSPRIARKASTNSRRW